MNGKSEAASYFAELSSLLPRIPMDTVSAIAGCLFDATLEGRTVFLFGNGGSASTASHMSCDLNKTTLSASPPRRFRAIALTDNMATILAWANDACYADVFAEQLRNFVRADDILIAISGSGKSENVIRALRVGREAGAFNIGLTGFDGGNMKTLCDLCLVVPSNNMQMIEDVHLSVNHCLYFLLVERINRFRGAVVEVPSSEQIAD